MLRSNPPPLIHVNSVLDAKIGHANVDGNTEREDVPLNLTCRRPPSNDCCTEDCRLDAEKQLPNKFYAPIAKWGVAYHPVLNLASEEYARYYYAHQQYRENLENHVMAGSDCNISVGWNLPYYSPYWHILSAIMKQRIGANPIESNKKETEVESIGNGYYQQLSPPRSDKPSEEKTAKSEPLCAFSDKDKMKIEKHDATPLQLPSMEKTRKRAHREDKLENQAKGRNKQTEPFFECKQCGARYTHRFELNRHIKVSHIRPHRCGHCGKGFGHKNYLRVHIETVHMGRKTHKCEECGKYLSTGGNLSVHVRTIHMGEKKYRCPVCSRTFGQQCNMKTHMRRHYINSNDKSD